MSVVGVLISLALVSFLVFRDAGPGGSSRWGRLLWVMEITLWILFAVVVFRPMIDLVT